MAALLTVPVPQDRYRAHQAVERAYADLGLPATSCRPYLWRHRGRIAEMRIAPDTVLEPGDTIEFELDAVPYRKVGTKPGHARKKRTTFLTSDEDRREWLESRFAKTGLLVTDAVLADIDDTLIVKDHGRTRHMVAGVRYLGRAVVHDAQAANSAMVAGVGDFKCYGYGMIVIRRRVSERGGMNDVAVNCKWPSHHGWTVG